MAASISVDYIGMEQMIRITLPQIERLSITDVIEMLPKAIADKYVKEHRQEIMDSLSLNEIATQIGAAIAAEIVKNMPKPEEKEPAAGQNPPYGGAA